MKKFSVFFISMLIASSALAEKVCFGNMDGLNAVKEKFPEILQKFPVTMGVETTVWGTDVIALVKIFFEGDTIVLTSDVWKMGARYKEKGAVKEACYDTDSASFTISFRNGGKPFEAKYIKAQNVVLTQGVNLKRLSDKEQRELIGKITVKESASQVQSQQVGQ